MMSKLTSVALAVLGLFGQIATAQTLAPGVKLIPVAMGHALENINSVSFSRNNLYSVGTTQYIAFYSATTNIVVGRRQLGTTNWEFQATSFLPNSATDGHDVVSLGVSGDGILHLSWGMHGNPYHYACSVQPWSLALVATNMTSAETFVTYPQFINCPNGDLLYVFREGGSGSGNTYINRYSAVSHAWTNVNYSGGLQPFIKGVGVAGSTHCSAYPNFECLDAGTNLQISWCWRNTSMNICGNQDMLYARSPDYGVTWQRWNGSPYVLPITRQTAENIYPIATNHDLINMSGQCLDTNGRPVICTWWAPQGAGTPLQYSIIWNDGVQWRRSQITHRITTAAQTWPTRPLIVCDKQNRLWVVFTDPERGSVPTLAWCSDPNRTNWNFANLTSEYMGDIAINVWGGWEPTHDPVVWRRDGKLNLFYQPITHVTTGTLISVLEFDPEVFLRSQPPVSVILQRENTSQ